MIYCFWVNGGFSISLKYKKPLLQFTNVALTSPYTHNARFKTLKEVLDHYDGGMKYYETIDASFIKENNLGIHLEDADKDAIIAFLNTLTDYQFV